MNVANLRKPVLHKKNTPSLSEQVREHAACFLNMLDGVHLNSNIYNLFLEQMEKPLIEEFLNHFKGNQSQAALALGISRGTLRKKMKQYDLL